MIYNQGSIFRVNISYIDEYSQKINDVSYFLLVQIKPNKFLFIDFRKGNRILSDEMKGQDGFINEIEINKILKKIKNKNKQITDIQMEYIGLSMDLDVENILT